MAQLGVNIDHVATIRQARRTYEPDPVWAAVEAQLGGADLITVHLREDRRHIQDHDVERIRTMCQCNLNLEMAATDEMVKIAKKIRPHMVTLVPEGRMEVTTEGGLNVSGNRKRLKAIVKNLNYAGIAMSAFSDAESKQSDASAEAGFQLCEIHTGPYAHAFHAAGGEFVCDELAAELKKVADAGGRIQAAGMQFNAGHALNYLNVQPIARLTGMKELHIGHAIVSRAVFTGLREAVREMKWLIG